MSEINDEDRGRRVRPPDIHQTDSLAPSKRGSKSLDRRTDCQTMLSQRSSLSFVTGMHRWVAGTGRWILALLVAVHATVTPIAAFADSGVWTNREICRAAVKTYFFLDAKPTDTADNGQFLGFLSASGNIYTCRIEGTKAEFRWLNASGQTMTSKSTRFHVRDGMLTVYTNMMEERFSTK